MFADPTFAGGYALFCISKFSFYVQHRPIRYRRYGHDGLNIATAAGCNRTIETRSCNKARSRLSSCIWHCQIHQRTWTRGLLARWIFQSESQSIPREKFLHCSVKLSTSILSTNTSNMVEDLLHIGIISWWLNLIVKCNNVVSVI